MRGIVTQGAYGVHVVKAQSGPIERSVPAIGESALKEQALTRLAENKRYSGGRTGRNYLLRTPVTCAHCDTACTGDVSVSSMGYSYSYYSCHGSCGRKRVTNDKRPRGLTCPKVKAGWLQKLVWADVRSFLENPGEVLQRAREQFTGGEDLEERHAALTRRLASKRGEKDRYVKLYAQGLVNEEELEVHLTDLKYQVENLKLLIASVEADLTAKDEEALVAQSTEAWLLTLRENLAGVERDTEQTFESRRQLGKLLVKRASVSRGEDGRPRVEIIYRFGPPAAESSLVAFFSVDGVQYSEEFARAHGRGGSEGLLRRHPKMSFYEVAVERETKA